MAENQEVTLHFSDYWRVVKNRWPIILTIFVLVVTTAYFYTKTLPKIYAASAVIKVDDQNKDMDVFAASSRGFDAVFFQTEFELIQSKTVLRRVIKQLELRKELSQMNGLPDGQLVTEDQAFVILKRGMLAVQPYRNTKLIEIAVNSTDPVLARRIANMVAQEYEAYRQEDIKTRSESGLSTLKAEMDKQKAEVDRAKAKVEKMRKDPDLDFLSSYSTNEGLSSLQDQEFQRKEQQLSEMKSDVLARKVRLDKIKDLSLQELEAVLPSLGLEDGTIATTKQNLFSNQTFLKSLEKQGFESEHPRIKSTQAQIKKLRDQLDGLLIGVKRSLEIDLGVSEAKLASLEAEVIMMREKNRGNRSDKMAPYEDAVRDLETQNSLYSLLVARYKQESVDAQILSHPVTLINEAEDNPNPSPIRPNLKLNIALSAAVGLVLGVSLAFFIEYLDTSVKSLDDVERYLNTSVVGVVPEGVNALNLEGPDSPNAEAYRILRAKIDLKAKPDGAHTLTVVSGGPGEGKTTTLFNLAYVCAYSGINTLIVDTDFRRHSLNSILGVSNDQGVADFLLGYGPLHEYIRATEIPNLHVITAGKLPPQCMGALSPSKMSEIVETLKPHYDVILFDAPPILGISDAAVIVHEVDTTLLAIQHRRYPRNISWRAKKVVEEVGGRFGGVILNKVHLRSDDSYYYYTSYYGYYGYYKTGSRGDAKKKARENKRTLQKRMRDSHEPVAEEGSGGTANPGGSNKEEF